MKSLQFEVSSDTKKKKERNSVADKSEPLLQERVVCVRACVCVCSFYEQNEDIFGN